MVTCVFLLAFVYLCVLLLSWQRDERTVSSCPNKAQMQFKEGLGGKKTCLIKTHPIVLSSASQMTSDQRTLLAITIRLWVVFPLCVSSRRVPRNPTLTVHLIGLSCFLTSLSWVFTQCSLTQRCSDYRASENLSSLTRGSAFKKSVFASLLLLSFNSAFQIPHLRYLSLLSFGFYLHISIHSHFWRVREGFTETAICRAKGYIFAICCKIKLGELVYLPLNGPPLTSPPLSYQAWHAEAEKEMEGDDLDDNQSWD